MRTFPGNAATPDEVPKLARRSFLRTFALCSVFVGTRTARLLLAEALPQGAGEEGVIKLDITQAEFAALQNANHGSVLVTVTGMPAEFAPVIITRTSATVFLAVSSRCTHAGCTINPYQPSLGSLFCTCHGSQYSPDGRATAGPALLSGNLEAYTAEFDGQKTLNIHVPGLGFSVVGAWISSADGGRFRIDFPTVAGMHYEIRYRPSLKTEWVSIAFALSAGGPADQKVFIGTGTNAAVLVDAPGAQGYFGVARY